MSNSVEYLAIVLFSYFEREEIETYQSAINIAKDIRAQKAIPLAYTEMNNEEVPKNFKNNDDFHTINIILESKSFDVVKYIDDVEAFRVHLGSAAKMSEYLDGVNFDALIYLED